MILIKTPQEIQIMQEGGNIARKAVDAAVKQAKVGMTTLELNSIAEKAIVDAGGMPCFKGFEGFPSATCININSGIVHGIPNNYRLRKGDIVSVDLGVLYKGLNTDVSESFELETDGEQKFLEIGRAALAKAIEKVAIGKKIGDISNAIQTTIQAAGFSVSRDLAGHGVGREIHEDPYVECFGRPGRGYELKEGMTLAIEVIYQKGRPDLVLAKDGWTLSTKDGSLSGLFEKSVAVTRQGVLVLT
jgi:methionyl aminopeptidase